ncbi:MAG: hypothetical protein FWF03_04660 [Defluviitaleaceae bacterium]|nr:hypothetical protein [Defluviitaleaceae bacterium]
MWTRFQLSVRKAVELIDGGAIGKVKHVVLDFGFRSGVDPNGRLFAPALAGGSLLDVGVYNVSFASMLYKRQPDRILSHLDIGITGVDESASVLFNYGGGQSASLFSSIRLNTSHEAIIYGEEGSIRLYGYWHGDTVHLKNKDGASEIKCEQSGFCHEAAEVMACVGNSMKESPLMPLDESIEIMRTMDRIRFDNNLRYPFEEE